MSKNAKTIGLMSAVGLVASIAFAEINSTNSAPLAEPLPVVHSDRQSHNTATNAIIDPAGSLNTNRIPAVTNVPTPMPTPLSQDAKQTPTPNPQP